MRKAIKNIISLTVVLIAGLNYIVPVFAQDPFTAVAIGGFGGASGAGLFSSMAGMSGINISWSNNDPLSIDAMWDVTNPDYVLFHGEKHEADPQSDPEDIYDYIKVDIGDWLAAQSDFIVNFAQDHNIQDNDSGNVSGNVTTLLGLPAIENSGYLYTDPISIPATTGQYPYGEGYVNVTGNGPYSFNYVHPTYGTAHIYQGNVGCLFRFRNSINSSYVECRFSQNGGSSWSGSTSFYGGKSQESYNVDWTSKEVNTGVFDGWESAKVKIPKSVSQLQSGWTPVDFFNELDRIWYGAGEDSIIIEDGNDEPPVPPGPVPSTPLGNVPFDDWVDLWGQGIYEQLENQSDALDLIGSNGIDAIEELESIDTNTEDLVEVAESIDTNIGVGNGILGGIRSLAKSAVDYLEGIAEHVGELVEEIVEGTETLIAGILNQIPQVFSVIFGPIKQASSIWHYVVEWIQSISAPFQFIWSMASGTSYYIILPVYASLAAAVVLAFYKRFGK